MLKISYHAVPSFTAAAIALMRERGITQLALAKALDLDLPACNKLLHNHRPLYLSDAIIIADTIGTTVDRLMSAEVPDGG